MFKIPICRKMHSTDIHQWLVRRNMSRPQLQVRSRPDLLLGVVEGFSEQRRLAAEGSSNLEGLWSLNLNFLAMFTKVELESEYTRQ